MDIDILIHLNDIGEKIGIPTVAPAAKASISTEITIFNGAYLEQAKIQQIINLNLKSQLCGAFWSQIQ